MAWIHTMNGKRLDHVRLFLGLDFLWHSSSIVHPHLPYLYTAFENYNSRMFCFRRLRTRLGVEGLHYLQKVAFFGYDWPQN
jgi:hypothetical protein